MEIIMPTEEVRDMYYNTYKRRRLIDKFKPFEKMAEDSFGSDNVVFGTAITADLYTGYPLSVIVKETVTYKTLHELITQLRNLYKEIYKTEDETMTRIVKHNPNLINRGTSDGKFGIWGHVIDDLWIEALSIYEGDERPIILPFIGS